MESQDGPIARAAAMGAGIAAAADDIERTRRIPPALLARLHEARACRMLLPRRFDGDEVDPVDYLLALEELARHDGSVAWNVFTANSAALLAAHLEPDTARTVFGPPDALVAWGPPNATVAAIEPGGYRVSGRWDFASGARHATWMGVHCMVAEPGGAPRQNAAGRPAIVSMLFPADRATLVDTWDTIGLRGTASDSYSVEDLFVPDAFTGTREVPEARREPGPLYAIPMQGLYGVGVAAIALGIAGAMLAAFEELARSKSPRGLGRLADSATVQGGVARAEARLGAGRAYLVQTLSGIHARAARDGHVIGVPDRARVRLAACNAIQGAVEVADWTYKQAGVSAIFPGTPFERRFRDIHTVSQQIQSRDAHFESVGQVLLGRPPAVFF